jgi:hypothetical protein
MNYEHKALNLKQCYTFYNSRLISSLRHSSPELSHLYVPTPSLIKRQCHTRHDLLPWK